MLHNNYVIVRNLLFGDKKKNINIKINPCEKFKRELDLCLQSKYPNCDFIKKSYQKCIYENKKSNS